MKDDRTDTSSPLNVVGEVHGAKSQTTEESISSLCKVHGCPYNVLGSCCNEAIDEYLPYTELKRPVG